MEAEAQQHAHKLDLQISVVEPLSVYMQIPEEERTSDQLTSMSKLLHKWMASEALEKLVHADTQETCSICLDNYETCDEARKLDCHHSFHLNCISMWMADSHKTCPLCRGVIFSAETEIKLYDDILDVLEGL